MIEVKVKEEICEQEGVHVLGNADVVVSDVDGLKENAATHSESETFQLKAKEVGCEGNDVSTELNTVMSKRAMKRLKKKIAWETQKHEKRAREKERRKKRKHEGQPSPAASAAPSRKKLKETTMANSSCKTGLVIDLSFSDIMDEKSMSKCMKQVCRCYSINRRASNPLQFHVSSVIGKSLEELSKHQGYRNWDVNFHDKHYSELFTESQIVYLTSESENVIEKVEDDKVYIIGGLVDHNSQKGLCHRLALEKGFSHARLPIAENIDLKTRKVLTIDHGNSISNIYIKEVYEIISYVVFHVIVNVCNGQSWKEALLQVLPARKGAREKSEDEAQAD
nr:EOG090X0D3U [Ilyocryptus agilis]